MRGKLRDKRAEAHDGLKRLVAPGRRNNRVSVRSENAWIEEEDGEWSPEGDELEGMDAEEKITVIQASPVTQKNRQ